MRVTTSGVGVYTQIRQHYFHCLNSIGLQKRRVQNARGGEEMVGTWGWQQNTRRKS